MELENKPKTDIKAWIASVAVSVLCCSAIFVVFANYIIEVKGEVRDMTTRMNIIEKQQQQATADFDLLQKRVIAQEKMAAPAMATDTAPLSVPPAPPAMPETPIVAPAPAAPNPMAAPVPPSAPAATPAITVPVMPAPADKK